MTEGEEKLAAVRHSLSHLLAAAVLELWPEAKPTIGPAIEDGFYYDFDDLKIKDAELPKIEAEMRKILPNWRDFTGRAVSAVEAREFFKNNPYKLELIDEIAGRGEALTLYTAGDFTDLCRGGHIENPAQAFAAAGWRLDRVSGAYWRGDEKNQMLTRIYGLAFESEAALGEYLARRAEAEKRDHRRLGRELDLFVVSPLVGAGLPLFTPRGTLLRDLLDDFVWQLRQKHGYQRVDIPHLARQELYRQSGHWEKFHNELFQIKTREGHELVVKPMNCPHHVQIYNRRQWSFRELPQRYATTTKVYRDEQSGELGGLARVRSITQDDAHVFCRRADWATEIVKIWEIIDVFYGAAGFRLSLHLSLHDEKRPEDYLGTRELWHEAEAALRQVIKSRGAAAEETIGEASFYGPKIDFVAKDSLGRKWQLATIQLDFNLPERFNLCCINEKGEKERIVMLHAAIMGSLERYLAILIEHYGGAFPLWLSPVQATVLPVGESHREFARALRAQLTAASLRAELDLSDATVGKKIREFRVAKIPYAVVVGDKEIKSGKLTVESRDNGKLENVSVAEFISNLQKEVRNKK